MSRELGKPERGEVSVGQSDVQRWGFREVPRSIGAARRFRGVLRSDAALAELSISCSSSFPLFPQDCNHDLKNLFKGAAIVASSKPGPFQEFYAALLAKGMKPEMARLTLARKIATIALIVWKRGVCFDAQYLKPQTA
jgi:hypothetical protein